jgi:hypothetical protein
MEENLELNNNTDWNTILDLIAQNKFLSTYKNYSLSSEDNGYLIKKKTIGEIQTIFLLDEKMNVKIYLDNNNFQEINVFTNLDIESYIKAKGKKIDDLFFKGKIDIKYSDHKNHWVFI